MTTEISDRANAILEEAARQMIAAGMQPGSAPWRAMAWNSWHHLDRADLLRLREMLDRRIAETAADG